MRHKRRSPPMTGRPPFKREHYSPAARIPLPLSSPLPCPNDPGLVLCAIFAASNKFTQIYIGRCPTLSNTLPDGDVYYAFRNECGPNRHRDRRTITFQGSVILKMRLARYTLEYCIFSEGDFSAGRRQDFMPPRHVLVNGFQLHRIFK